MRWKRPLIYASGSSTIFRNPLHSPQRADMANDAVRHDVWHNYLDAARLVRYYEALSDKYRRKRFLVRFLLLMAAASGIAALLKLFPENSQQYVQLVATGFVALLVVWDSVSDYASKVAVLHTISFECTKLEHEWQKLWTELNSDTLTSAEVLRKNDRLAQRITEVTSWADLADVREDQKLNERCTASADTILDQRYAA